MYNLIFLRCIQLYILYLYLQSDKINAKYIYIFSLRISICVDDPVRPAFDKLWSSEEPHQHQRNKESNYDGLMEGDWAQVSVLLFQELSTR